MKISRNHKKVAGDMLLEPQEARCLGLRFRKFRVEVRLQKQEPREAERRGKGLRHALLHLFYTKSLSIASCESIFII